MSNESIERFNSYVPDMHGQGMGICLAADGKYIRYSDHQRIVKELEAQWKEHEAAMLKSMAAQGRWIERLRSAPPLSDAIKEAEKMRDDQREIVNIACVGVTKETITFQKATILLTDAAQLLALDNVLARLKSLGTQG